MSGAPTCHLRHPLRRMPWLVLVHLPHDQAPLLELAGSVLLLPPPRGGGQRRAAVAILAQESDAVGPPS